MSNAIKALRNVQKKRRPHGSMRSRPYVVQIDCGIWHALRNMTIGQVLWCCSDLQTRVYRHCSKPVTTDLRHLVTKMSKQNVYILQVTKVQLIVDYYFFSSFFFALNLILMFLPHEFGSQHSS